VQINVQKKKFKSYTVIEWKDVEISVALSALWLWILQIWPSRLSRQLIKQHVIDKFITFLGNLFSQRPRCIFGLVAGLMSSQHVQVFAVISQSSLSHQRLHSLALQNYNPDKKINKLEI